MPPAPSQPYFVPHQPGTTLSVRDAGDEGATVDSVPQSVNPDGFAPRLVNVVQQGVPTPMESLRSHPLAGGATDPLDNTVTDETSSETTTTSSSYAANSGPLKQVMDKVFGTSSQREVKFSALDASAKKVAPKIFFAGERTFLAWMEAGVYLAGLSMALGTYADVGSVSDWFAVVLHPVAIGMIFYSMYQYAKRSYMISMRSPGPFEDRWGPVVIGSIFVGSLVTQFFIVLFSKMR